MSTWLSVFFHNIGEYLFYPSIVVTIAAIVCFVRLAKKEQLTKPESNESYEARWWTIALVQISVIAWIITILCKSVPVPEMMVKEVTKIQYVNKVFDRNEEYLHVYKECRFQRYKDYGDDSVKDRECNDRAVALAVPVLTPHYIRVTQFKTDPYPQLFATCMGDWAMKDGNNTWSVDPDKDGTSKTFINRSQRIETCHKHAIEVIQAEK